MALIERGGWRWPIRPGPNRLPGASTGGRCRDVHLFAIGSSADEFVAAGILGVLLAAWLTPRTGSLRHLLVRYFHFLAMVWLALAALLDFTYHLYAPH